MSVTSNTRVVDPRPARTRAAIYAAVRRLVTVDGAEITVNAIATEAGVSRTSFYAQFADLDALAVSMLVDAFRDIGHEDITARQNNRATRRDLAQASSRRLVQHIAGRRPFYRASLDWKLTSRVHETVIEAYADQVLAVIAVDPPILPADLDPGDAARFVAGGVLAVLTTWLRDEGHDWGSDHHVLADRLVSAMPPWLTESS
ncbi:TetR/AcrR family transcriptional regulator [Nesterenkonia halotolerans]|uniref:AcrR family transcriptional regulator n=1 Tax=Nesterenkonia halotolerans TaxID=225325 RepID=A0ABR9J616_9MICC|nr:TetR/AcrR family transcriptional regulator [Nesterenkonia halotolerans]MBE1514441.1 AcrR family transcriptional regulator [Nesterenkonia halotolerans]